MKQSASEVSSLQNIKFVEVKFFWKTGSLLYTFGISMYVLEPLLETSLFFISGVQGLGSLDKSNDLPVVRETLS